MTKRIGFFHRGLTFGGVEKWMHDIACHINGTPGDLLVTKIITEGLYSHPIIMKKFESATCNVRVIDLKEDPEDPFDDLDLLVIPAGMPDLHIHLKGLQIPVLMVSHGVSYSTASQIKWTYKSATHFAAVCPDAVEVFPDHIRNTCSVILNGTATSNFQHLNGNQKLARVELGIPNDKDIVLQVARHSEEKNPRAIIQALLGLGPDWIGLSIGEGPLSSQLIEEASAYVPGRLMIAKPDYPVDKAMMASDVLLIGSDTEALPYVMLEAFAMGLPVVSTMFPELRRIKRNDIALVTSIPFRAPIVTLAKCIQTARTHPHTKQAYEFWKDNYQVETSVRLWEKLFEKIIEDRENPSNHVLIPVAKKESEMHYL